MLGVLSQFFLCQYLYVSIFCISSVPSPVSYSLFLLTAFMVCCWGKIAVTDHLRLDICMWAMGSDRWEQSPLVLEENCNFCNPKSAVQKGFNS